FGYKLLTLIPSSIVSEMATLIFVNKNEEEEEMVEIGRKNNLSQDIRDSHPVNLLRFPPTLPRTTCFQIGNKHLAMDLRRSTA
ncbi:hypothetical protein STEG23_000934, partial [Scotinomys teguina]